MDAETRGFIEKGIDNVLRKETIQYVKWIEDEFHIISLRDIMIGYLVGTIEAFAESCLVIARTEVTEKEAEEIRTIIKRRLPKIIEKTLTELSTYFPD